MYKCLHVITYCTGMVFSTKYTYMHVASVVDVTGITDSYFHNL